MPHLPTTRKERQVADLERKVERLQRDQRFQRLRTRPARRGLVVLGAIFLVGIIPAYTQSGVIAGTLVTAAAWPTYPIGSLTNGKECNETAHTLTHFVSTRP